MNPEDGERGPNGAPPDQQHHVHHDVATSVDDVSAIPEHLRRRRDTSRRLAVLDSGLSDPWTDVGTLLPLPSNLEARRKSWMHLNDLGLVDDEGWITALLTDAGGATW